MKVKVPARAPTTPPDMGASMKRPWPEERVAAATPAEDLGSMVLQSMKRRSEVVGAEVRRVGGLSICWKTFWTWWGSGRTVKTVCWGGVSWVFADKIPGRMRSVVGGVFRGLAVYILE